MRSVCCLVASLIALLAFPSGSASAEPPTRSTPDLDRVRFHASSLPGSVPLALRTFDASTADLGTGANPQKVKKHEAAVALREMAPGLLATAFRTQAEKLGAFSSVTVLGADEAVPEGAVLVEGRFTLLNPGSKGKRYWVGMGAGKAKVCFAGRVLAPDGSPAADFEHCRVGTMGFVGGDAAGLMATDVHKGGANLADFVVHFARGAYRTR